MVGFEQVLLLPNAGLIYRIRCSHCEGESHALSMPRIFVQATQLVAHGGDILDSTRAERLFAELMTFARTFKGEAI